MSIYKLERMSVVPIKGGRAMTNLLIHNAPTHAEGYWLMAVRKTPKTQVIVMDMTAVMHYDIVNIVRRVGEGAKFTITRINYTDDPETCWRVEWDAHGLKWRVQWFWDEFIDMDLEAKTL